jgi:uncharacterized phage protein gp47/JayE
MAFNLPSRDALALEFVQRYASSFPEKNVSRGSDPYRLARVVSGGVWSVLAFLSSYVLKQLLPDTADEDWLRRWAKLYDEPFLAAAPSSGVSALAVSGVAGSPVPNGTELSAADGTLFEITSVGAVLDGAGNATVDVVSITTGLIANKTSGTVLEFSVPPAGLNGTAILATDLTGGREAETADEYRVRLQELLSTPPEGGAIHDYVTWLKRVQPGISVFVWRFRRGLGTIDYVALQAGSGAQRIIADTSTFTAAVDAERPANVKDALFLTVNTNTINFRVRVEVDSTRFQWDWDDTGVGWTITAVNAGTKQITVPGIPAGATVGKRIQVLGFETKITARLLDVLTLDSWPPFNPIGSSVRTSGDLVVPVQNAVTALVDSLGPPRGNYAATQWLDSLRLTRIGAAVEDTDGVIDYAIDLPVANLIPLDAPGTTTSIYVAGVIDVFKL